MTTVRRWRRPRIRTLLAALFVLIVSWSAYSYWSDYRLRTMLQDRETMSPGLGTFCRIVLRSDALGVPRSGTRWGKIDGTENFVEGTFLRTNDRWVVLARRMGSGDETDVRETWIPREQVLLLEIGQ